MTSEASGSASTGACVLSVKKDSSFFQHAPREENGQDSILPYTVCTTPLQDTSRDQGPVLYDPLCNLNRCSPSPFASTVHHGAEPPWAGLKTTTGPSSFFYPGAFRKNSRGAVLNVDGTKIQQHAISFEEEEREEEEEEDEKKQEEDERTCRSPSFYTDFDVNDAIDYQFMNEYLEKNEMNIKTHLISMNTRTAQKKQCSHNADQVACWVHKETKKWSDEAITPQSVIQLPDGQYVPISKYEHLIKLGMDYNDITTVAMIDWDHESRKLAFQGPSMKVPSLAKEALLAVKGPRNEFGPAQNVQIEKPETQLDEKNGLAGHASEPVSTASAADNDPFFYGVEENDVLCGRGSKCYDHSGNVRLRERAETERKKYLKASRKVKRSIGRDLVDEVKALPGRFLERVKTGVWVETEDKTALDKCMQALRVEKLDKELTFARKVYFAVRNEIAKQAGVERYEDMAEEDKKAAFESLSQEQKDAWRQWEGRERKYNSCSKKRKRE